MTENSGLPLQHFVVSQIAKLIRKDVAACDSSKYKPKKEIYQPLIQEESFLLQTQNGKFIYACLGEKNNVIVLPIGTMPLSELSQIAKEVFDGYRPVESEDYNYFTDKETLPVKETQPTPELLIKESRLTLISRESILSDTTYHWGQVIISVSDHSSDIHEMDVVTLSGEYIRYLISWDSLIINASPYDLSWDGSPDREKELYSNRGKYGNKAYVVVKNKEEYKRLIPLFWQIIKRVIGDDDDKVIAVSIKSDEMLPLTLEEARRKYDVRPVVNRKHMEFKNAKPESWDYEDEGFPAYYFSMGSNETGLLIDRLNSSYMIPYLFSKTKWYKEGIKISELEIP